LDVVVVSAMVAKLQEQLLVRKRELDSRENALMAWEYDLAATECALGRARMECDTEWDWAKVVRWDYRDKMRASTAGCRRSLDFDQVLRGRQFILTAREMTLNDGRRSWLRNRHMSLIPSTGGIYR
jgi:hypothetical protein